MSRREAVGQLRLGPRCLFEQKWEPEAGGVFASVGTLLQLILLEHDTLLILQGILGPLDV